MAKVTGPSGRLVETIVVDFDSTAEPWETFELSDGTVAKVRATPLAIFRLDGEYDAGGNPVYAVNWDVQFRVVKAKMRGQPTITAPPQTPPPKRDPSVG